MTAPRTPPRLGPWRKVVQAIGPDGQVIPPVGPLPSQRGAGWVSYRWRVIAEWKKCGHSWDEITDVIAPPEGKKPKRPDVPDEGRCPFCPASAIEPGQEPPSATVDATPWLWRGALACGAGLILLALVAVLRGC